LIHGQPSKIVHNIFIVSRGQPKLVAPLTNIVQANSEALRGCIDKFTKETVEVLTIKWKHSCSNKYYDKGLSPQKGWTTRQPIVQRGASYRHRLYPIRGKGEMSPMQTS